MTKTAKKYIDGNPFDLAEYVLESYINGQRAQVLEIVRELIKNKEFNTFKVIWASTAKEQAPAMATSTENFIFNNLNLLLA